MLAKRIIPTILVRGRTAYKGPGFGEKCTRSVGSALAICRTHARRGVDELLILDIGATPEGRGPDLDMVRELSEGCFIPITVGGGVRTLDDVDALLRAGADKVAIGASARGWHAGLIDQAADRFGSQAIVVVVEHDSPVEALQGCQIAAAMGAGEVVLQSRAREGKLCGYDLEAIRAASAHLGIPLIASGGCSGPTDMADALHCGADAVAAGALFQFSDSTPRDCSLFLKAIGVEVRV